MSAPSRFLLANETWSGVFSHLSLHNLTSVSRASKTWQTLAFPHLYRTVCLAVAEHLKALAQRIESDVGGPLSLRTHIRGLIFDNYERKIAITEGDECLSDDDLDYLLEIVPKLPSLQHFSWDMPLFPENMEIISVLQAASLKSIDWWVWQSHTLGSAHLLVNRPDDFLEILKFKNLTHLALRIRDIGLSDFEEDFIDPIASCVMASPNLESLTLEFCDEYEGEDSWEPDLVVGALGNFTFPSLRSFRTLGVARPSGGLFSNPPSSPLATFFLRHPKVHTIGMGWDKNYFGECVNYHELPEDFAALFPSIKHLEAPLYMCHAIMASSQAEQLESVSIIEDTFEDSGIDFVTAMERIPPLPNLRKLAINGEHQETIEIATFQMIAKAAPNLEELKTRVSFDEPDQLLELLKLTPNLRVLDLLFQEDDWPRRLKTELGVSSLGECIPALLELCPLLRCIGTYDHGEPARFLIIERGLEGGLETFESTTH